MNRVVYILLLLLTYSKVCSQDVHFSQFYSNPLYLAPSFAGSAHTTRFVLNYRDQWPAIPGTFTTTSFSVDHLFPKIKSGMGFYFLKDNVGGGKMSTTIISFQYSYKVKISNEFFFDPGLSAYYYNRKTDYSKVNFADQFFGEEFLGSTSEMLPDDNVTHVDFSVSLLAYSKNSWYGITVDHLMSLSPVLNQDYSYTDLKFSLFGGMKLVTKRRAQSKNNETMHLAINIFNQAKINQLNIGGYYFKKPVMVGLWYRGTPVGNLYPNSDAIIYLIGVKFKEFTFTYSYDMTLGNLISTTGGSHEISITYGIDPGKGKEKRKRIKSVPCPEF